MKTRFELEKLIEHVGTFSQLLFCSTITPTLSFPEIFAGSFYLALESWSTLTASLTYRAIFHTSNHLLSKRV